MPVTSDVQSAAQLGAGRHPDAMRPRNRRGRPVLLLLTVLAMPLLGACQGMYEGSERRTVGETVDDSYVNAAINRALLADAELSFLEIDVDVRLGVVVLQGAVPSREAEAKLVAVAKGVRGVREVQSRLVIVPGTPDP
jgi:hyperosmotically inducible protein